MISGFRSLPLRDMRFRLETRISFFAEHREGRGTAIRHGGLGSKVSCTIWRSARGAAVIQLHGLHGMNGYEAPVAA